MRGPGIGGSLRVRIGISNTDKVVELEIEDAEKFKSEIEKAVEAGGLAWLVDSRGRTVGVPAQKVAYVEIEDAGTATKVGFGPG